MRQLNTEELCDYIEAAQESSQFIHGDFRVTKGTSEAGAKFLLIDGFDGVGILHESA